MNRLYAYAKEEWTKINKKTVDKSGILYQRYSPNEIFLYVPVVGRVKNDMQRNTLKGPDEWVKYIDAHIKEDLSVISLAENYNYSVRHFSNTFELYFGIRPGRYIKKRKLYLAASELKNENVDIQQLVDKFGLQSEDDFRKSFFAEFHSYPEKYSGMEYKAEDMKQYYSRLKETTLITYTNIQDFSMYGKNVCVGVGAELENHELLENIVMELKSKAGVEEETKVVVWQTLAESEEKACLVGSEGMLPQSKEEGYIKVVIKGGRYAVMESQSSSEEETLLDTYRMLYRCAFGGWIRENQVRMDFHRLTFVRYHNGKLYFYIPVNA